MRRSDFTDYTSLDTQIFEYKNQYYVLQMCQQGQELDPDFGPKQLPSDFCSLSSKIPKDSSALIIGNAVKKALKDFDTIGHPFDKFDIPSRNKLISSCFGARGMASLEKNSRVVQILENVVTGTIRIIPFDNHNRNNFNGPMEDKAIELNHSNEISLGEAIKNAFLIATHHPARKDQI